jgi:DNA polymerase V
MLKDMPEDVIEIGRARGPGPAVEPCPPALFTSRVEAGFPSPADDYLEGTLDLNEHLIARPAATFFLRVSGDSMTGAGIYPGDILIVDRSLTPADGRIVIAVIDGELTVKRLHRQHGRIRLVPENPRYPPIEVSAEQDLHIWGVVVHAVHSFA